ncbi:MAG: 50S ribosomal protein L16 [Saprospiraceae bacterium]
MLQPKRIKYRKQQKPKLKKIAQRGTVVSFGSYGLKAITGGRITNRQIEAARIAMTRYMKREGQVWIRIFPDRPITRKPLEVRMGKGKGSLDHYVAIVEPGRIMFELDGVNEKVAREALRLAAQKLPVLTKVTVRPDLVKF